MIFILSNFKRGVLNIDILDVVKIINEVGSSQITNSLLCEQCPLVAQSECLAWIFTR